MLAYVVRMALQDLPELEIHSTGHVCCCHDSASDVQDPVNTSATRGTAVSWSRASRQWAMVLLGCPQAHSTTLQPDPPASQRTALEVYSTLMRELLLFEVDARLAFKARRGEVKRRVQRGPQLASSKSARRSLAAVRTHQALLLSGDIATGARPQQRRRLTAVGGMSISLPAPSKCCWHAKQAMRTCGGCRQ